MTVYVTQKPLCYQIVILTRLGYLSHLAAMPENNTSKQLRLLRPAQLTSHTGTPPIREAEQAR